MLTTQQAVQLAAVAGRDHEYAGLAMRHWQFYCDRGRSLPMMLANDLANGIVPLVPTGYVVDAVSPNDHDLDFDGRR